jgi:methyltransferase (TIGR00027 family)
MPTTPEEAERLGVGPTWLPLSSYMGVRTRFFDEFFESASAAGVGQVVILASGLDVRAFRLDWPAATTVFEIDQPKVLEFKDEVMAAQGVSARSTRRVVPVDLREDWASALTDAGFDERLPTAWLAEGLMPYLPAEAEQQLLDTIDKFSVPGSRVAIETTRELTRMMRDPQYSSVGEDWGVDMPGLLHDEDGRPAAEDSLRTLGWTVTVDRSDAVAAAYGRDLGSMPAISNFITAESRGY